MIHANTIKAEVRKRFPNVKIISVNKKKWGLFVIKVEQPMKRKTRVGLIWGETDYDKSENGVVLDKKVEWLGSK